MNNNMKVAPERVKVPLKMEYTEHALLRMLQRRVSPTLIPALASRLCQAKLGERVAVQGGGEVLIGVRASADVGKIVTAWRLFGGAGPEPEDIDGTETFHYVENLEKEALHAAC